MALANHIPLALGTLGAAGFALFSGPPIMRLAWRLGMLDRPKLRGVHAETVPRAGGLMLAASLLFALAIQLFAAQALRLEGGYLTSLRHVYLMLPALALLALGALDDLRGMSPLSKLSVQAFCGAWAWALGFTFDHVSLLGIVHADTGWLSLPLTVLFIVGVTNAVNMIDGIDGLCAGSSLISLVAISVWAMLGGIGQPALVLPLAAACAGFLRHNFGAPKSFLGDSGSMFVGFLLATLALEGVRHTDGTLPLVPLFLVLAMPIIDICVVFARRVIQGRSPIHADRGHIHHIALQLFDSSMIRACLTLLAMALIAALGAFVARHSVPIEAGALAVSVGLFAAVYLLGGYFDARNVLVAGPVNDRLELLSDLAQRADAERALDDPALDDVLRLLRLTSLTLCNAQGDEVWRVGEPTGVELRVGVFAGGRAHSGTLTLTGRRVARSELVFAAQILLPIFGLFAELLAREPEPVA